MKRMNLLVVFMAVLFLLTPHLHAQNAAWDALHKAARAEGKVILQLGTPTEEYRPVIDGFEKRFQGVKIEPLRATGPSMISRVITESAAKNVSVDVAFANFLWVRPLLDRDLLIKEDWAKFGNIDRSAVLLDGRLLTQYGFSNVLIYNTNLVSPSKIPKTWEDLTKPEWKGQICVPQTQIGVSIVFEIMEESKAVKLLEALGKQNLVVESGANMTLPRCANGEVALADTIMSQIPAWKEKGSPIEVSPISPQWDSPFGVYSLKGSPHPNAARLLMAWLITPEGKAAMKKTGRGPSSPCDASVGAQEYCNKGVKLIQVDSIEKAVKQDKLIERTRTILGLKPPT